MDPAALGNQGQRFLLYTIIVGDGDSIYINSFVYFSILFILVMTVYILLTNNKLRIILFFHVLFSFYS